MTAPGLTEPQVVDATKKAVATYFTVDPDTVTVTATETRRLHGADRKLAGTWSVNFEFLAPASKVAAVTAKVTELNASPEVFSTAMTSGIKAALTEAGVDAAVLASVTVTSHDVYGSGPTTTMRITTAAPSDMTDGTTGTFLSVAVIVAVYLVGM